MIRMNLHISVVAMSVMALSACTFEITQPPLPEQTLAPVDVGTPDDRTGGNEQVPVTTPTEEVVGDGGALFAETLALATRPRLVAEQLRHTQVCVRRRPSVLVARGFIRAVRCGLLQTHVKT